VFGSIDVKVHELDTLPDGDAIQQLLATMSGQRTVPSVWVGGKFLGGNDDVHRAYQSGKILSLLDLPAK
jgi:glutaredoxin 3